MIRQALDTDRERILEMARRFMDSTFYGSLMRALPTHLEALFLIALHQGVIYVWEQEPGEVLAFIALVGPIEHPMSGELYGEEIAWWVEPELRGADIGRALLAEAETWASAAGICVLKMIAPTGSGIGRFYDNLGYTAVETTYMKRLR